MNRRIIFLAAAALVASAVVHAEPHQLKDAAKLQAALPKVFASVLADPAGAQFQNVAGFVTSDGKKVICGEVNAKNAFGGYVGFKKFFLVIGAPVMVEPVPYDQTTQLFAKIFAEQYAELCK